MKTNIILQGDCIEQMKLLEENSVDAIVTDPPYGLEFMGKDWDKFGISEGRAKRLTGLDAGDRPDKFFNHREGAEKRGRYSEMDVKEKTSMQMFMQVWATECLRVLKPGGFLLSFGGTRTYHRLVCGIEDAGFEIRDTIMWLYGSGFPKSLNIGKQVDKINGNEREVVGTKICGYQVSISKTRLEQGHRPNLTKSTEEVIVDKGNSEWEGWGTALKPACEPIVVARKPLSEKNVALNVLKHGTGGINIDDCRIKHNEPLKETNRSGRANASVMSDETCGFDNTKNKLASADPQGRFPANIILDEESGKMLDEQTGDLGKSQGGRANQTTSDKYGEYANKFEKRDPGFGDRGGASRFFKSIEACQHLNKEMEIDEKRFFCSDCQKWINCDNLEDPLRFFYCAKASKSERNFGCEELDEQNVDYGERKGQNNSTHRPDGSERKPNVKKNNHPTVKPIKLMEYLIKLVSSEGAVVLDPFLGSGTTAIACEKLNRKWIGIEKEEEYVKICEARLKPFIEQEKLL